MAWRERLSPQRLGGPVAGNGVPWVQRQQGEKRPLFRATKRDSSPADPQFNRTQQEDAYSVRRDRQEPRYIPLKADCERFESTVEDAVLPNQRRTHATSAIRSARLRDRLRSRIPCRRGRHGNPRRRENLPRYRERSRPQHLRLPRDLRHGHLVRVALHRSERRVPLPADRDLALDCHLRRPGRSASGAGAVPRRTPSRPRPAA